MYSEYEMNDHYDYYSHHNNNSHHSHHNNNGDNDDIMMVENDNLSTEVERQSWLPQIVIPGPFVVMQGSVGDGMANTINTSPTLPSTLSRTVPRQGNNNNNSNSNNSNSSSNNNNSNNNNNNSITNESMAVRHSASAASAESGIVTTEDADNVAIIFGADEAWSSFYHVSRSPPPPPPPPPPLGSLASVMTIHPYVGRSVMNMAVVSAAPSFSSTTTTTSTNNNNNNGNSNLSSSSYDVIVPDQDSPENDFVNAVPIGIDSWQDSILSPAAMEAIGKWKEDCMDAETKQYQDWKESSMHQVPSRLKDHVMMTQQQQQQQQQQDENGCWWQPNHNHQVAILRDIPTKLNNGTVLRTVIGSLPPGTTLMASDIVHLDSTTLQRLTVLPLPSMDYNNNNNNNNNNDDETGRTTTTTTPSTTAIQRRHCRRPRPRRVYAKGQKGVIQLLQVQTPEGRTGYAVSCLDGYTLVAPGWPQNYIDPQRWIWRVTCPAGAFVRDGLDLSSQHRDTIPHGSLIHVTRRSINNQGLSRLKTHGTIPSSSLAYRHATTITDDDNNNNNINNIIIDLGERHVDGFCSELLNPLSGQRGIVVQPLPFPVPAIYRVILPDG
jgi:hypothetical protein